MAAIKQLLSRVDWYKTILGLMILLFGSLLLVTTLIIPYVREVKKQNVILGVEKTSYEKAKAKFEEEDKRLKEFKKENAKQIGGFHTSFNPTSFSSVFGQATLLEFAPKDSGEEKVYKFNSYDVTAGFKSPRDFFDLLKTLDDANFISQITYPVVVTSKNGVIYSAFGMRTYIIANEKAKRKPSVEEGSEVVAPVAEQNTEQADAKQAPEANAHQEQKDEKQAGQHKANGH